MEVNNRKIYNDYFLKKTKSKITLKKKRNKIQINKSNSSNKNQDLYKEEINYNIESSKTMESKQKNGESISIYNKKSISIDQTKNHHKFNTINIDIKSFKYERNLENQIKNLKKQLNQLLEYKNICEKRIKSLSPEEVLPLTIDSLNPNLYSNRSENKIKFGKIINTSYSYKHDYIKTKKINYEKTLDINSINSIENIYKNKYISLYRKYTRLLKENKNSNINIIKLQNFINKLKSEKEYILKLLEKEKDKNKDNFNYSELNDKANEWREQAEIFRKDLVLSQVMVNSLKSEINILNKNKLNKRELNNGNNKKENNNNINKKENNENYILKKTLADKNTLISNLLEENYKLNIMLKSIGINIYDYNSIYQNNKHIEIGNNISLIKEMKNVISQYENKIGYFNDYINKIKNEINLLYKDINQILNDKIFLKDNSNNKNNLILAGYFYEEIHNIKNQTKDINIDLYNLDYSNDIKCIDYYKKLMKMIKEELIRMILINKNFDLINEKENKSIKDLLILSKNLISNNILKKSLSDILNINKEINKLYKQKILSEQNNNNIDTLILNQEKEIEKKKKSLLNNSNIRKTYNLCSKNKNKSNIRVKNESKMKNYDDFNYTTHKNSRKVIFRNHKSLEEQKHFHTYKKYSISKDKIKLI